jgi:hypothetical protein
VVADLPPLEAILLSSDDPSCFDLGTLLALDKQVPVFIPAAPPPAERAPRLKPLLADLGFTTVRTLRPGEARAIGTGGEIAALPGPVATARTRVRGGWALVGAAGAAITTGPFPLGADDVAALVPHVRELVGRVGPVSPMFVANPRRRRAPIETGWQWLFTPAAHWLRAQPEAPGSLVPLVEAAQATSVVVVGDEPTLPEDLGAVARLADCYDRYRLGAAQDGWLEPRR